MWTLLNNMMLFTHTAQKLLMLYYVHIGLILSRRKC